MGEEEHMGAEVEALRRPVRTITRAEQAEKDQLYGVELANWLEQSFLIDFRKVVVTTMKNGRTSINPEYHALWPETCEETIETLAYRLRNEKNPVFTPAHIQAFKNGGKFYTDLVSALGPYFKEEPPLPTLH